MSYTADIIKARDEQGYSVLAFVYSDTKWSEPIRYRLVYKLADWRESIHGGLNGTRAWFTDTQITFHSDGYQPWTVLRPTECPLIERTEEPIPCPKVRKGIETRYRDGRWQKYTRAEGWINA